MKRGSGQQMKNFTCHPFFSDEITIHTIVIRIEKNSNGTSWCFHKRDTGSVSCQTMGGGNIIFFEKMKRGIILRWFSCMLYTKNALLHYTNKMIIAGGDGQTRWFLFGITNFLLEIVYSDIILYLILACFLKWSLCCRKTSLNSRLSLK